MQQALLLQAVAEKQGLTCDTDTLNTEFVRQFGMSDPSYLTDVYGENYVKSQLLNALVMQNLVDNVQYE